MREGRRESRRGRREDVTASRGFFWGLLAVISFAIFTPSGPVEGTHGVVFAALGLLLFAFPPRQRLPRWLLVVAGAFAVFASLHLLPRAFGGSGGWRGGLEALGLETGGQIAVQPLQSLLRLLGLAAILVVALAAVSHRVDARRHFQLALGFTTLVGIYAAVSMIASDVGWHPAWDIESSFGLFPNRNHTGTLLVLGFLCGLAVLYRGLSRRQWLSAGVAGVSVAITGWATLGYNVSRAGALLLGLFATAWLLGLGRRHFSVRMGVCTAVLAGLAVLLFVASDASVKRRIVDTIEVTKARKGEQGALDGAQLLMKDAPLDFRMLIYSDALKMIGGEAWTGIGLGGFRYVFPQYREASATNALCLHPESDWLMLAAETGVQTAALLIVLLIGLFVLAWRGKRRSPSWPLHLGCLLAAAVVPVHGLFDVPGHRVGIALSAVFLLTITLRSPRKSRPPMLGALGRGAYRLGGGAIALGGAILLHAQWFGGEPTALSDARVSAERIRVLYIDDLAVREAGTGVVVGEDPLELAISIAEGAILQTPLDPELHFLRGGMAINFDDKNDLVDRTYAIQRLLAPRNTETPLRQSISWASIDPGRSAILWQDALSRARFLAATPSGGFEGQPRNVWNQIMNQAKGDEELLLEALPLATGEIEFLLSWIGQVSPGLLAQTMPELLVEEAWDTATRRRLLAAWKRRGARGVSDAEAFAATHPEWFGDVGN